MPAAPAAAGVRLRPRADVCGEVPRRICRQVDLRGDPLREPGREGQGRGDDHLPDAASAAGGGVDAGKDVTTGNEGGVVPPPPPPGKDGGPDPGKDSGVVVTEKPAPVCHDLTQHDAFVVATATPSAPPAANPLATFTPG